MEILLVKKQLCPCCMYCDFADEFYATEEQMQKNDICLKERLL